MQQAAYPVQLSIDYPDRALDRMSTAFRILAAIPILIKLKIWTTAWVPSPMVAVPLALPLPGRTGFVPHSSRERPGDVKK